MIVFKVLDRDFPMGADKLRIAFPDENGIIVDVPNVVDSDLMAFTTGAQYTLAGIPFVPASDPVAVETPTAVPDTTLMPVDHPVVIHPEDAAVAATPDEPSTVSVDTASDPTPATPVVASGAVAPAADTPATGG